MTREFQAGVVDHRFLAKSLGLLNPPTPLTVKEEDTLKHAIEVLQKHKIGALVVVDKEEKITGIFTERDVTLKVILSTHNLDTTLIRDVMTKNPQTAEMTTTVAFALNMMSQGGYRHIPIADADGSPVGIISVKDVVDYIAHAITKDIAAVF